MIYPDTLGIVQKPHLSGEDDPKRHEIRKLRQKSDAGELSRHDFWNRAAKILGISREDLDVKLDEVRGADWQLLDYIKSLKKNYKTGLLSNVGHGFIEKIFDEKKPQQDYFDIVVISGEVGVLKPDPHIYQVTAKKLGVTPKECIFVDDRERNCEGARAVGMRAILYQDFEQMKEELEKLIS